MTLPIKILPVVALVVGTAAPAFADSMTTWVPPGGGAIAASMLASGAAAANLGFTPLNPANNLSELSNAASARASLGFGSLLPNLSASVEGTGLPGLDGGHWFIWNNPGTYDPNVTLRVDRRISSGSGASGGTNKAIWGYSSTNPANQGYEWTITGQQDNTANASTGAQNVAVAGYIFKQVPTNTAATISASGTGSTATVTFAGGATIPVGHSALIAGVTPTGYNGTYKVTASASGSISFASTATGAQTVAGTIVDVSVSGSWGMNGSCEDKTADVNPVAPCLGAEFDVTADSATTDRGAYWTRRLYAVGRRSDHRSRL